VAEQVGEEVRATVDREGDLEVTIRDARQVARHVGAQRARRLARNVLEKPLSVAAVDRYSLFDRLHMRDRLAAVHQG
jgi:hypothetical protein